MARFRVTGAFVLRSCANFVLTGNVTEGAIRSGMRLRYESEAKTQELDILDVEFVDHISGKTPEIGLCLRLKVIQQIGLVEPKYWVSNEYECI
jgi:hypothetical protein